MSKASPTYIDGTSWVKSTLGGCRPNWNNWGFRVCFVTVLCREWGLKGLFWSLKVFSLGHGLLKQKEKNINKNRNFWQGRLKPPSTLKQTVLRQQRCHLSRQMWIWIRLCRFPAALHGTGPQKHVFKTLILLSLVIVLVQDYVSCGCIERCFVWDSNFQVVDSLPTHST